MPLINCEDCGDEFNNRNDPNKTRCWKCYQIHRAETVNPFARKKTGHRLVIPKEWNEFLNEIPALLQLCHPDRHDQSEGSKRITAWLLAVKKRYGRKRKTG